MKKLIAISILALVFLAACFVPGCTTTNGNSSSSTYIKAFTVARTAEDVLKLAENYRLAGKVTDAQFAKVKAAYDALREAEQLVIDGKSTDKTAITKKVEDLAAVALEVGVAYSGGE